MIIGILLVWSTCIAGPNYQCENQVVESFYAKNKVEACNKIRDLGHDVESNNVVATYNSFFYAGIKLRPITLVCEGK